MKYEGMQKGFTLIELMMVVAIIAILATMILTMLNSGRERAKLNRYISYATQMYRLVGGAVAAGQFDGGKSGLSPGNSFCLGDINYDCGAASSLNESDGAYKALTYLSEMPKTTKDNAFSPYNDDYGVYAVYKPDGENVIRVYMYLLSNDNTYLAKVCDSINWAVDTSAGSCYADVPLNARM